MSIWQDLMSGALGEYTKNPSWVWRVILFLALVALGVGFLAYFVALV
jgi:hypothetical protein